MPTPPDPQCRTRSPARYARMSRDKAPTDLQRADISRRDPYSYPTKDSPHRGYAPRSDQAAPSGFEYRASSRTSITSRSSSCAAAPASLRCPRSPAKPGRNRIGRSRQSRLIVLGTQNNTRIQCSLESPVDHLHVGMTDCPQHPPKPRPAHNQIFIVIDNHLRRGSDPPPRQSSREIGRRR